LTINRKNLARHKILTPLLVTLSALLAACSDSNNNQAEISTLGVPGGGNASTVVVPAANIEGPIAGVPVLVGTFINLPALGYTTETEFFVSGTANAYTNVNELGPDGKWQVQASEQADYRTRVVVIRPTDPANFNGTVMLEWLNVSAGFDSPPDWLAAHTELIRSGYAWVGVSAQADGVKALMDGSAAAIIPGGVGDNRYDSLDHPGDKYSYSIFSQIAQAIREPEENAPLGNLVAQRIIAAGESQSAGRMVTYVNAFAPMHALFDGYFIHSRTAGSAPLQGSFNDVTVPTPAVVRIRNDLGIPSMMVQTETDLFVLGSHPSNQDDNEFFRLWEIAGTAHADLYTFLDNRFDLGTDPSIAAVVEELSPVPGIIDCTIAVNAGPQHFVVNAAVRALNTWIVDGTAPPIADRLEVAGNPPAFVKDTLGNVKGGIRTSYVETPIAILEGEGQPQPDFSEIEEINLDSIDFCFLSGTTALFDAATLGSLYEDNADYVEKLNASTDDAVSKGFLLLEDAQLIKDYAASTDIFAP
tara:strand:- start:3122 stop:4708 length:1587 start_codon:yes stop_codon:yes gene_type:complete